MKKKWAKLSNCRKIDAKNFTNWTNTELNAYLETIFAGHTICVDRKLNICVFPFHTRCT